MLKHLLAVAILSTVQVVEAQVRVIDSSPQSVRSGVVRQPDSVDIRTENYNDVQELKQEVSDLRAMLEEQGHELAKLKQLQLDNYMDLDRRVSALTTGGTANKPKADSVSSDAASSANDSADDDDESESDQYKAAYDLLRQRQVDQSLAAFKDYLKKYPDGEFASNSYYWMGEICLLKNQLPQARDWFAKLIEKYPQSNKVPDARFKLGKVYHLMGDKKHAKPLLDAAAAGTGDSARLAKQYLKDNF